MDTYKIIRFYKDTKYRSQVIKRGLTLEQARAHCGDRETSSSTATGLEAKARTKRKGAWFDGYDSE